MSILATLALLMLPAAKQDDRDDFAIELKQARDEIEALQAERKVLRETVELLWRESDSRRREAARQYEQHVQALQMQQTQHAAYLNQSWQGLAQQAQNLNMPGAQQNMLGAQQFDPERYCNCVPSRSQMFS
jgi:hypothetical protein